MPTANIATQETDTTVKSNSMVTLPNEAPLRNSEVNASVT